MSPRRLSSELRTPTLKPNNRTVQCANSGIRMANGRRKFSDFFLQRVFTIIQPEITNFLLRGAVCALNLLTLFTNIHLRLLVFNLRNVGLIFYSFSTRVFFVAPSRLLVCMCITPSRKLTKFGSKYLVEGFSEDW